MQEKDIDIYWMKQVLKLAKKSELKGEVPIAAIIVDKENKLIASGHNMPISTNDPTAHAEIVAIRNAAKKLNNYRLPDTTIYVSLEPCQMCYGALLHARVSRLVYGAIDLRDNKNHIISCTSGVLKLECSKILKNFFKEKRKN